ncbi:MAG: helix-turn-helix domain-containing protein [Alphaproteobacteria bacterium]|nr:helix-turn-helix domain-containing protein [Alphaproteobacteria bacterium]MBU1526704.1 helix-turn-helix domain-containing protein [Alphaproteobacteria bacterium]MBU2116521.1 helix-turn-helix domain-containing protein [Alphaproteobacteria bacterium]MBU2352138.1 helix-turn-helix domain-containing protein [Alphaproteobacteria bacterium]MBU2381837.1 helix-turn-helix domain-containing protein [Alphaproteobacteria bacterium]
MGESELHLGWRTALLGATILQLLALAVTLAASDGVRVANRLLAALLIVIAGMLIPYAIGFAGFYDAWRGLTFLPVAISLAIGPLLWAYASTLDDGRPPRSLRRHLVPPAIQFAYSTGCFLLPLDAKWDWYTGGHRDWIDPVFEVATLISLAGYTWAAADVLRRRDDRLAQARSDDHRFAAGWLKAVWAALALGLALSLGFSAWSWLTGGIDFFQQTGLYLGLGLLGLWLGVGGWRHAGLPQAIPAEVEPDEQRTIERTAPDWTAVGAEVERRVRQGRWWREPELSLADLARRLGTNTGRLSRAINLGLGVNFSVFINGLRAEAVAEALRDRPAADLLDLAFEMGFASKASFNRAFRARFGLSPSEWRRGVSDSDYSSAAPDLRRDAGAQATG